MKRSVVAGLLAALVFAGGAAAASDQVSVTVDRSRIKTQLGRKISFKTTIANTASTATGPLIAHLNVLSLRSGVEVDPEDWSTHRTRYLGSIDRKSVV